MQIHSALMAIATPQFDLMVAFYQQLLGQAPQPFQADRYAEFALPGLCLALFLPKPDQASAFALAPDQLQQSPTSLCLKLRDLEGAIARVKAIEQVLSIDCCISSINASSHGKEIYIYDPQGNRVILYQPLQLG